MIKASVNNGKTIHLESKNDSNYLNGEELIFDLKKLSPGTYHVLLNNKSYNIELLDSNKSTKNHQLRINGKTFDVQLRDRYDDLLHELGLDANASQKITDLKAPMPGLVVDIPVTEGQLVKKGDTLLILEAMKMENTLKAIADVTINHIMVKKGQAVDKNQVLIQLS